MLLTEEYARLTGHCEAVGLSPHFLKGEFGNTVKGTNGLGNAMVLPCVGTLVMALFMFTPGVLEPCK